jgi:hypothetical protein
MIWLSNCFSHCVVRLSEKSHDFHLAIFYHIADLPFHQIQITTMEKNERGNTSKDHQLLFYRCSVPAAAVSARGIHALPYQTKT